MFASGEDGHFQTDGKSQCTGSSFLSFLVKRLKLRIVQMEEEAKKYGRLKVSVYENLKGGLIVKEEYAFIWQEKEFIQTSIPGFH